MTTHTLKILPQDHEAALAREWRPIFPHGMTLHRVTGAQ